MMKNKIKEIKIIRLTQKNYLAMINNSVGSKMFQRFYARFNGQEKEVLKNGKLSCAFYVSSILAIFGQIKSIHTTVESTIEDLKKSEWKKIKKPKIGSVLVWEEIKSGNDKYSHIGFYVGNSKAISNSSRKRIPMIHDWEFNGKRKISTIYYKKISNNIKTVDYDKI